MAINNRSNQISKMIHNSNRYQGEGNNEGILSSSEEAREIADKIADNIVKKLKLRFNLPANKNK